MGCIERLKPQVKHEKTAIKAAFSFMAGGELFQRITALPHPVNAALLELWLAVGRRGRKATNSGFNGRKRGRNQGLHAPWLPVKSAATWQ